MGIVYTYIVNPNEVDYSKFLYLTESSSIHFKVFYTCSYNYSILMCLLLLCSLFLDWNWMKWNWLSYCLIQFINFVVINIMEHSSTEKLTGKFIQLLHIQDRFKTIPKLNRSSRYYWKMLMYCVLTRYWRFGNSFPCMYDDVKYGVRSSQSSDPMTIYAHQGC